MNVPRLSVHNLRVSFGRHAVLRGVDLELRAGECVGLIGPNGSGKSSLLRACLGLIPSEGTLAVDGLDPRVNTCQARARLGWAVDPSTLPATLRLRQCIELVAHLRGLGADAIEMARLRCDRLALTPWLESETGTCSLGTRQKLAVVLALLGDPPVVLLDEVLNGLDPLAAWELKHLLREQADAGAAVLLATHGLNMTEQLLDRVVLLLDGNIAAHWDHTDLHALHGTVGGLEAAVVEHLRAAQTGTPTP